MLFLIVDSCEGVFTEAIEAESKPDLRAIYREFRKVEEQMPTRIACVAGVGMPAVLQQAHNLALHELAGVPFEPGAGYFFNAWVHWAAKQGYFKIATYEVIGEI